MPTFYWTSKESRPAAGRDRRTWFSGFGLDCYQGQRQDRGSRPADALLFVQTATKSKQKRPFSCGGHGIREGRRVLSPGPQLTWQRLRSTERQRPQLNKFRWAGLCRWRFVGNAGGENEIFPNAGPACFGYRSSAHPAAPVFATARQCLRRIATIGKSDPRRRAPCPVCQRSENTTFPRECHRALAGLTSFLCLLSIGRAKKVGRLPAGTGELGLGLAWIVSKVSHPLRGCRGFVDLSL